jgi:hypothetical protein
MTTCEATMRPGLADDAQRATLLSKATGVTLTLETAVLTAHNFLAILDVIFYPKDDVRKALVKHVRRF